jgi:hypothetical protein
MDIRYKELFFSYMPYCTAEAFAWPGLSVTDFQAWTVLAEVFHDSPQSL